MTHALSITDGTTTVSLVTSGVQLSKYTPSVPDIRTQSLVGTDGDDVANPVYENVTETIEIMMYAASTGAVQTIAHGIDRLLDYARQRQKRRSGPRVYLQLQIDGDGTTYRSEILTGRLELNENALEVWGNYKPEARIHLTRRYFWEGSETELQLSTSNQSAATGGRTIYNHDDSGTGHDNWVQIAAAQVDGVLPAPLKLSLSNNTGSSQDYRTFYFATNAYSDPANFTHILEGENVVAGYGTSTADANSSGGNYAAKTVNGTAEMWFPITAAVLQKAAGKDFRLIMRQAIAASGTIYITPQIRDYQGLITLATGDEVRVTASSNALIDLGTLPLPPGGYSTNWGEMRLVLSLRTSSSINIGIDFFQLTPTDSYRKIYQRGYPVANGDVMIDNGIDGYTVLQESGGNDQPIYTVYDAPLMVFPNKLQRIYFLHDEGTSAAIANTFSVRAYYRPRRLSI